MRKIHAQYGEGMGPSGASLDMGPSGAPLGLGPQSGRVVAQKATVFAMPAGSSLCPPQRCVPATLHFTRDNASGGQKVAPARASSGTKGLAKMRVCFLLNPA